MPCWLRVSIKKGNNYQAILLLITATFSLITATFSLITAIFSRCLVVTSSCKGTITQKGLNWLNLKTYMVYVIYNPQALSSALARYARALQPTAFGVINSVDPLVLRFNLYVDPARPRNT